MLILSCELGYWWVHKAMGQFSNSVSLTVWIFMILAYITSLLVYVQTSFSSVKKKKTACLLLKRHSLEAYCVASSIGALFYHPIAELHWHWDHFNSGRCVVMETFRSIGPHCERLRLVVQSQESFLEKMSPKWDIQGDSAKLQGKRTVRAEK